MIFFPSLLIQNHNNNNNNFQDAIIKNDWLLCTGHILWLAYLWLSHSFCCFFLILFVGFFIKNVDKVQRSLKFYTTKSWKDMNSSHDAHRATEKKKNLFENLSWREDFYYFWFSIWKYTLLQGCEGVILQFLKRCIDPPVNMVTVCQNFSIHFFLSFVLKI